MSRFQSLRWTMRRRLRRLRYTAEDAAYSARRATRRRTWRISRWWAGLSSDARALLAGAGVAVLGLALVWLLVIPSLPCEAPLGDQCPRSDDAIELVPADAAAYAHVVTDPGDEQYENAAALASRLPVLTEQLLSGLPGADGARLSYSRDVAPWLGDEAAVASIPAGGRFRAVALLAVRDADGAAAFTRELTGAGARTRDGDGEEVTVGNGTAVARLDDFLVAGPPAAVAKVIGAAGGGESLLDSPPARDAIDALPANRLAELYFSQRGAADLLDPGETLGSFEVFVNAGATRGAAAALVADAGALELTVHSLVDPQRADASPGFFAALPEFDPNLGGEVTDDALAYLALGDPEASLGGLLAQARAGAPGLALAFDELSRRLRRSGGIDLEADLLSLLTSEAAVAIEPGRGGPGDLQGVPYVTLIAGGVDTEEASATLESLQGPLARALAGGSGAPVFSETKVEGVTVRSLRVSNAVELAYGIVDDKLVASTDPQGIARVAADGPSITDSSRFEAATSGFPSEVAALLYLNVKDLLGLAEQAGLQEDPSYALFRDEFQALKSLGVAVERGDEDIDTRIRLALGR